MLKRNALTLGLVLSIVALWAVRPAAGDDDPAPEQTELQAQIAEHETRIAALERLLGNPQRNAGTIQSRLRAAELEIQGIARDLEAADGDDEDGDDQARTLRRVQRSLEALSTRVERMDHNRIAGIEREIATMERTLRDLDSRLRRIE